MTKMAINRALGDYVTEIERESYEQTVCNFTEDMREAITAYQEKRTPQFKGQVNSSRQAPQYYRFKEGAEK
jgi:hypothetical protein